MPVPTVTRPSASVVPETKPGQSGSTSIDWTQWARWFLIGAIVLGAFGIAYSLVVWYSERSHTKTLTAQWDELYSKTEKPKTEESRIEALEQACEDPKIKGTAAHGYALMQLASANFDISESARRQPESRAAALERAVRIYEMLSSTEPFKSHPSFGPVALSNLGIAYEQQIFAQDKPLEFYDKAIDTLQSGLYMDKSKDADPIPSMKTHFLFDKMNAQLGRMYWLRSLRRIDLAKAADEKIAADKAAADKAAADKAAADKAAADKDKKNEKKDEKKDEKKEEKNEVDDSKYQQLGEADRALALKYIKYALDLGVPTTESERFGGSGMKAPWREQAGYLRALLEPAGKMLKNGVPPVKPEPPPQKADAEKKDEKKDAAQKSDAKAPDTKAGEKKAEKPAEKKDEKPADKKDDAKKTGSVEPDNADLADDPSVPRQHLTYAQIQQLLKQGKPALCQCPRCANAGKAIGAKLAE
ncbi:MAG TPA: hypothetical protein VKX17_09325 [Planctomycetota bacterium]|nr:hypothetical protein [Planctomycetota bacterium]